MANTDTVTEAAADVAHNASGGMPQLDFSTFPNQIFWLVVTLAVIYFALSRLALPRIGGTLAARKGQITSDIAAADELKQKAVAAEKAYDEALVKARAEAAKIMAATRDEIKADLTAAIAKADAEIAVKTAESAKQIDEIRAGAAEAVAAVAKDTAGELMSALGGSVDAKAITAAVTARLKG